MKTIDRTILAAFVRNYLASLVVLVGLYVMMDAFFNFDEIARGGDETRSFWEAMRGVVLYYTAQGLFIYGQLAGIIPVVAAAFTLMRMSRFNELTALLAAGVPLIRVAAPIVVAAAAINFVVQPINQELVVPRMAGWLTLERWEAASGERESFIVEPTPAGDGTVFMAAQFRPASTDGARPATAVDVTVIDRPTGDGGDVRLGLLTADEAVFDPATSSWLLTNGLRNDDVLERADFGTMSDANLRATQTWETVLRPKDVELARAADLSVGAGGSYYDLLSTGQITDLLEGAALRGGAPPDLVRAKHARLAGHVMNLVLILLAVPAVLTRQPGELRKAAGRTLLLIGSAMGTIFLCQMIAREPPEALPAALTMRWPALVCWVPVFIFGPMAVVLLDRMKS